MIDPIKLNPLTLHTNPILLLIQIDIVVVEFFTDHEVFLSQVRVIFTRFYLVSPILNHGKFIVINLNMIRSDPS